MTVSHVSFIRFSGGFVKSRARLEAGCQSGGSCVHPGRGDGDLDQGDGSGAREMCSGSERRSDRIANELDVAMTAREQLGEYKDLEMGKLWVKEVWGGRSRIQFRTRYLEYRWETILHGSLMLPRFL